ncbi:MAG: hypothetical protein ABSA93_20730 [Streptosporangiaceae bacterium]
MDIIVDVANVMGSRPDGWWRDRAGAAQRLYEQIAALPDNQYFLVLEGQAKAAEAPDLPRVKVIRAPGSGDEAIVTLVRSIPEGVIVVTADRELRRRCEEAGATVQGPRWLTHMLLLRNLVINPTSSRRRELMLMLVVAIVLIVLLACSLYALDRALKVLARGRRRRNAAERLFAAASVAEEKEKKRRSAEEKSGALTSVMPAIVDDKGPRKVA